VKNSKNPESRIDELLFQEATTKISAPNSMYYCSIDQKFEVKFSSFYMGNQKAVTVVFTKLTKPKWKISKSKIETKLFKVFLYIGTTKTLRTVGKKALFLLKNLELLNRSSDVGGHLL
jgi:hypothetical protein